MEHYVEGQDWRGTAMACESRLRRSGLLPRSSLEDSFSEWPRGEHLATARRATPSSTSSRTFRKHGEYEHGRARTWLMDPFSSEISFSHWKELEDKA